MEPNGVVAGAGRRGKKREKNQQKRDRYYKYFTFSTMERAVSLNGSLEPIQLHQ